MKKWLDGRTLRDSLLVVILSEFVIWAAYAYHPAQGGFMFCADACSYSPFPWGLGNVFSTILLLNVFSLGMLTIVPTLIIYVVLMLFRRTSR